MPDHVLDTTVLQVMGFSDPDGITILLTGLGASRAVFPAEVYNRDENSLLKRGWRARGQPAHVSID